MAYPQRGSCLCRPVDNAFSPFGAQRFRYCRIAHSKSFGDFAVALPALTKRRRLPSLEGFAVFAVFGSCSSKTISHPRRLRVQFVVAFMADGNKIYHCFHFVVTARSLSTKPFEVMYVEMASFLPGFVAGLTRKFVSQPDLKPGSFSPPHPPFVFCADTGKAEWPQSLLSQPFWTPSV